MNIQNTPSILGVDIGRVIIRGDGSDSSFIGGAESDAMRAPAVEHAFESLRTLCERFERRIWLVSKCGPRIQARTRKWLDRHRFFSLTGVPYGNLRFCLERRDKAKICRELGIDMFVDDRADVLLAMQGVVAHRFQIGVRVAPAGIVPVPTWIAAEAAILGAMEEAQTSRNAGGTARVSHTPL